MSDRGGKFRLKLILVRLVARFIVVYNITFNMIGARRIRFGRRRSII